MIQCPNCNATLTEPAERFCPNCGADMGTAAPAPSELPAGGGYGESGGAGGPGGYGTARGGGGSTPWERRDQIGFVSALVETTKQVLSTPTAFFREMPLAGGLGSPLLYGLIIAYVGLVASTVYGAVFQALLGSSLASMSSGSQLDKFMPLVQGGVGLVFRLILGPVFIIFGMFIGAGIVHLMLLMLAGGGRGFEATFRVVAYSQATQIINLVPACGGLVAGVYAIVLWIIGLSEAHGISRGKAAAAVLIPIVVFCCCCIVIPVLAISLGLAGALSHAR